MRIGIVFISLFVCIQVSCLHAQLQVWWLATTPVTDQYSYEGIPAKKSDASFSMIHVNDVSEIPESYMTEFADTTNGVRSFLIDADMNGDGKSERFITGVFQNTYGQKGIFLATLKKGRRKNAGGWKVKLCFPMLGGPCYTFLNRSHNHFLWTFGLNCDYFANIVWKKNKWTLETPKFGD
jgi:hypothetical protein